MANTVANPVVPAGARCDVYRENISCVQGATTYPTVGMSDDYRFNAVTNSDPTGPPHTIVNPPYATQRTDDSWIIALRQNDRPY